MERSSFIYMNTNQKILKTRAQERGNVLWFILIALVLIGLLTAVVSRSGSTVDQSADVEQLRIQVGQMLRFVKGVEAAITNMKLQGIGENQISFQSAETGATFENLNCTNNACRVFHVEGGGVSYQPPPANANASGQWTFVGTNDVLGVGSTNADLVMMLTDVNQALCDQLNREFGVTYADDGDVDFTPFQGTYANTETLDQAARNSTGCLGFDNAGTSEPFFYHVLIQR